MVDTTLQKIPEDDNLDKTGIVSAAAQPAPADEYTAKEINPVTTEVDAGQETVESRLNKLTASGSKYTDLAKSDAIRSANSRGLINSSIAAGAGTEAAIRQALPIAQQDAQTYSDRSTLNQNSQNEFLRNQQSAELNKETAGHQSQLTQIEAQQTSDLDIKRDNNSAALNESLAAFESELKMSEMELDADLKLSFETALNDEKFSDEMKLQIVSTMNNIVRDFNQQITDIGMSDRTAEAQATAIDLVKKNRDAQLAVYEDLLSTFDDWDWGTNFTPESTNTLAEDNNYWNAPDGQKPITEPAVGTVIGHMVYDGNGVWVDVPNNY